MIRAVVSDFARVILFPQDQTYLGSLNGLHRELSTKPAYNPLDYFELNVPLLDFYRSLTPQFLIYIFTSDAIQNAPEFQPYLQPIFQDILSAKKMGIDKKQPTAYQKVATDLGLPAADILFIDDAPENIQAAKSVGMQTLLFTTTEAVIKSLKKELGII